MESTVKSIYTDNTFVFILSAMRTGSTLLKALLATRDDVSDLPEMVFSRYHEAAAICCKKIVVMKAPAYFHFSRYPVLPREVFAKKIILVRHPYDTILSLHKMNLKTNLLQALGLREKELLHYWKSSYLSILNHITYPAEDVIVIRYESLIGNPIKTPHQLFKFIGCQNTKGTSTYKKPEKYAWQWGHDDGGPIIKTLEVQNNKRLAYSNDKLMTFIQTDPSTLHLLKLFGYYS